MLPFLVSSLLFGDVPYRVDFEGIDPQATALLRSVSQLETLKTHLPETLAALKRRAEADLPNLKAGLQADGFYRPKISFRIEPDKLTAVIIEIDPGEPFTFSQASIEPEVDISVEDLGVIPGRIALPNTILNAEANLLRALYKRGYPLAKVAKREVIGDLQEKTIQVKWQVETGSQATFGEITIKGDPKVNPKMILNKIVWKKGETYSPEKVKDSIRRIEKSPLFSTVNVYHEDYLSDFNEVPMVINVEERLYKTVGFELSYNTDLYLGISADWQHRNIGNYGQILSLNTELWKSKQQANLRFRQPDNPIDGHDLLWNLGTGYEKNVSYTETKLQAGSHLEKEWNSCANSSVGIVYKYVHTKPHPLKNKEEEKKEEENEKKFFSLVKVPLSFTFDGTDHRLDATKGYRFSSSVIPTLNVNVAHKNYIFLSSVGSIYKTIEKAKTVVIAGRVTAQSILASEITDIPASERIYAGSAELFRGYKYKSVRGSGDGGQSLLAFSAELRWCPYSSIGLATFFEVGAVGEKNYIQRDDQWLRSVGAGIRYLTPIGPIRLDFAFPLNRRPKIDNYYEMYISAGQAF